MSHSPATSDTGESHGSFKSYLIGFILSIILTAIPFYMVMEGTASHSTLIVTAVSLAIVQILVHLVCFLHMNTSSEERWNLTAFIFTLVIITILLVGSVWIMHNLDLNMMIQ